jgi:branched-chain amino acid transport system ATP-binding protein
MSILLDIQHLNANYGATQVLFDLNLQIHEGGITTLLGANGAGKTTTLRAVSQMVSTTGTILLGGIQIDSLATEDIVRHGVAHVPDGRGTFTALTTEENLRLGSYTRTSKAEINADLEKMFTYFPRLKERKDQQAGTLSGGEQQMLAIARALMLRPRLLLLDEPSFGLAPLIVREIFQIMSAINQSDRVTILLVEQNAALALDLADHAYLLEAGRLVMSGSAQELQNDPAIRRSYLGD